MRQFSNKVIEELGYYVYALIDPRDHKIFYIGKGYGNRVFQHCLAAIQEDDETLKLNTIRAILNSGLEVGHYILRHKLSEEEALQMESLLIDVLTYSAFNTEHVLANIKCGYHQWNEGIKTVEEIGIIYECEKINIDPNDKGHILLVCLNRSYDSAKAKIGYKRVDIYQKTRKYWSISHSRAKEIHYVLGVYHGIVRAVLNVGGYTWSKVDDELGNKFKQERCCFEGILEDHSPYMNKDVTEYPFGSGGAFRYI